jgi:hypothetical protein
MEKLIFKSYIVYRLAFDFIILVGCILGAILIVASKAYLFFYIYIPLSILILLFNLRVFYIFKNRILITFLYKKEIIFFKDLEKVIYNFPGAAGVPPTVRFKTYGKQSLFVRLYKLNMYRFVLYNEKKLITLLSFFKKSGLVIDIQCSEGTTRRIIDEISKLDSN